MKSLSYVTESLYRELVNARYEVCLDNSGIFSFDFARFGQLWQNHLWSMPWLLKTMMGESQKKLTSFSPHPLVIITLKRFHVLKNASIKIYNSDQARNISHASTYMRLGPYGAHQTCRQRRDLSKLNWSTWSAMTWKALSKTRLCT